MSAASPRTGRLLAVAAAAGACAGLFDLARAAAVRPSSLGELLGHGTLLVGLWVLASAGTAAALLLLLPRPHRAWLGVLAPVLAVCLASTPLRDASWWVLAVLAAAVVAAVRFRDRAIPGEGLLVAWPTWVVVVAIAAAAAVGSWRLNDRRPARGEPDGDPANVLLISIDTLRADRLGVYGSAAGLSPNLDGLATDGIVFDHATAPIPLTGPSHVSMLSGLAPLDSGVQRNGQRIDPELELLPTVLAARGYRTGAFVSGFPLGHASLGMTRSFATYDDDFDGRATRDTFLSRSPLGRLARRMLRRLAPGEPAVEREAVDTTERALAWLDRGGDEPFFAFVHYFDPHVPYTPPPRFLESMPGYAGPVDGEWYGKSAAWKTARTADPLDVQRLVALYDAEVASVDHEIGRLIERLGSLGQLANTLIVVTADHGESFGEHGVWFDHMTLYETDLHVPLIVRLPGSHLAGTRVAGQVEIVDVAATVLDGLGLEAGLLPGASLLEGLAAGEAQARPGLHFAESEHFRRTGRVSYSVSDGRLKLIWNSAHWEDTRFFAAREELYELDADPGEAEDLIDPGPPELPALREELGGFIARQLEIGGETDIDPAVLEQLRSLGYVD
jgi:arylsulfatase A-like enzyme